MKLAQYRLANNIDGSPSSAVDVVQSCIECRAIFTSSQGSPRHRWHRIGELARGELTALIGVDDLGGAEFRKGLFDDLGGVTRFKRRGALVRNVAEIYFNTLLFHL